MPATPPDMPATPPDMPATPPDMPATPPDLRAQVLAPQRLCARPGAVLIDLDDTLYPYAPAHEAALGSAGRKAADLLCLSLPDFLSRYAAARAEIHASLKGTASAHSRLLYFQRLVERLDRGLEARTVLALEEAYWSAFFAAAQVFPQARELLADLGRAGVPTALVTDLTADIQLRKLVALGLDRDFDAVVTSEEAAHDKPHPAIFALALDKLRPGAGPLWMIGDDPRADIEGAAEALGAVTLQRRAPGVPVSPRADVSFSDFTELRELFSSLERSRGVP